MTRRVAKWISAFAFGALGIAAQGCVIHETPVNQGYGYGYASTSASGGVMVGEPSPYYVSSMPPEPLYEDMSSSPGYGYVWIDGSWHWNGYEWVWNTGRWTRDQSGYVYVQPYYDYDDGGSYVYYPGYWSRPERVPNYVHVVDHRDGRPSTGYHRGRPNVRDHRNGGGTYHDRGNGNGRPNTRDHRDGDSRGDGGGRPPSRDHRDGNDGNDGGTRPHRKPPTRDPGERPTHRDDGNDSRGNSHHERPSTRDPGERPTHRDDGNNTRPHRERPSTRDPGERPTRRDSDSRGKGGGSNSRPARTPPPRPARPERARDPSPQKREAPKTHRRDSRGSSLDQNPRPGTSERVAMVEAGGRESAPAEGRKLIAAGQVKRGTATGRE